MGSSAPAHIRRARMAKIVQTLLAVAAAGFALYRVAAPFLQQAPR